MSENRAGDGSLVFDTKINLDGFRKDLSQLEKLSETDIQVTGKAVLDKSDFESDVKELGRKSEKAVDTVTVETAVDDKGLKEDIAKLDDTAKRAVERLDSPISDGELTFDTRVDTAGVGNVMKGILGANFLQAGLEKAFEVGKKGVQLASDLEEVQNVVDVTFGQGAAQIEAFADSASTSFGLTELQAKQFSGTIGAMVKSMGLTEKEALDMSTSLVGLTGDMASFYNLDHQTAFDKIRSGLSGETEPLKQLGINMSVANLEAYALTKGIKKAYQEMSEAEKVNIRYGYIMQQTTDAQGDFVRTQDSYANQVRVLQNNLDTLAANVGGMLIPALTGAVSWVNSLFAGPETNALQAEIDGAIASLDAVDNDVQNIKNNYAQEAIKIQIAYEEAGDLIGTLEELKTAADKGFGDRTLKFGMSGEDVAALQNQLSALGYAIDLTREVGVFGASTEAALMQYQTDMGLVADGIAGAKTYASLSADDTARLAEVTAQLVALYPDLAQYVGKDGVLMLEKGQVDELIASYKNLQIEKLMASRVEQISGAYLDAQIDMELLKQAAADAGDELETLRQKAETYEKVSALVQKNYASGAVRDVQAEIDAIKEYAMVFGGLDAAIKSASQSGVDVSDLFGDDGVLKNAQQIAQMEDGLNTLTAFILELNAVGAAENQQIAQDYQAAETALTTATAAIKEHQDTLDQLEKDVETAKRAFENFGKEAEETGPEAGETVIEGAAQSITDEENKLESAMTGAIKRVQNAADRNPVTIPVRMGAARFSTAAYPGHATGLDYVPYDNYLARLHVGESVLTASEAQKWRENKGGGGVTPAQLTAAMAPVVDAIANIRIALDIDGRQFASNQAANTRTAQSQYGARIARGMGK